MFRSCSFRRRWSMPRKQASKWIFGIKSSHLFIALMIVCNVWWVWGMGFELWDLIFANVLVGGVIGGVGYLARRSKRPRLRKRDLIFWSVPCTKSGQ